LLVIVLLQCLTIRPWQEWWRGAVMQGWLSGKDP
jgi:hypothetical protein